jgi:hypothetical protein
MMCSTRHTASSLAGAETRRKERAGRWRRLLLLLVGACTVAAGQVQAQQVSQNDAIHRRGRIWENIWNDGFIGNGCAWDYCTTAPLGLFPGFSGFVHPFGGEGNAINTYANANFHNFRSGVWIVAKDLLTPGLPPGFNPTQTDYELYAAGAQGDTRGVTSVRDSIRFVANYAEREGFNPLLPEEMTEATWNTNVGITVTRRTYVWSYPGYQDFILYDYLFENTGLMVSEQADQVVPNTDAFQQALEEVWFAFHSGISVSTKSQINFHSNLTAVQAGAFGWQPPYHDYYHVYDDGALVFSTNYNGGQAPPPFDSFPVKENEAWKARFGNELQSPAAFGWLALYADPADAPRSTAAPDVLRIDTFKGNPSPPQDLEFFKATEEQPIDYYDFVTTPTLRPELGNDGDRFNFFTQSYGPYTMAPGDQVRIVVAEIAGVMDYHDVIAGDPEGHFPDSTIAAILRNAEHARDAVAWGLGAMVEGIPLAADVPEPPPAPGVEAVNASQGTEKAVIGVTWDQVAETTTIDDAAGVFYNGLDDLDGYRIYRSTDFQFANDVQDPVFRGAAWDLIADIPKEQFGQYFDAELGRYRYVDEDVDFGFRYGYYVSAYNRDPGSWTSANGTVVGDLPELASGAVPGQSRTPPVAAAAGPVASFDIYVVPNPFVFGDPDRWFGLNDPYRIEFRNLPERATIRIYTLSGDLVRTLPHGPDEVGNLSGTRVWDQKSDSGLRVAPGLYIYHVASETEGLAGNLTGKLMIIR